MNFTLDGAVLRASYDIASTGALRDLLGRSFSTSERRLRKKLSARGAQPDDEDTVATRLSLVEASVRDAMRARGVPHVSISDEEGFELEQQVIPLYAKTFVSEYPELGLDQDRLMAATMGWTMAGGPLRAGDLSALQRSVDELRKEGMTTRTGAAVLRRVESILRRLGGMKARLMLMQVVLGDEHRHVQQNARLMQECLDAVDGCVDELEPMWRKAGVDYSAVIEPEAQR